jgi:hypothetical protein
MRNKTSRRSFLAIAAGALASPVIVKALDSPALAKSTPDTFTLKFDNRSGAGTVNAYIAGTTPEGQLALVRGDGSLYTPPSPPDPNVPLGADCAIPVAGGAQVPVPKMGGARVYVVTDTTLDFFINPGPALVHPSFLNSGDPNFQKNWSFCEFTFNDQQLFANVSYVDFAGMPLGLSLDTAGGGNQHVPGLPGGSVDSLAGELGGIEGPWNSLVQKGGDGRALRVISPHYQADAFAGYLDGYIDQAWQKYAGQDLVVDSQNPGLGTFTGRVGGDGMLTFSAGESFAKPSTSDVWSCDSGPFAIPAGASDARKAIIPRLAAALNRTTLLDNPNQPTGEDPANFYHNATTNHYARIVHSKLPDNRGYAFPYDDVSPGPDFSGAVNAGDPTTLTVTINPLR